MNTQITELLGIKYPIIQGGMAWVADEHLASAVSNAGGLGLIAGGNAPKEIIREKIRAIRSLTDKQFGLNIMLLSPSAPDLADLVVEENVKIVTTGAGSPQKYMEKWKENNITVIPVVASVAQAVKMEKLGADAVIGEGNEAGGHIGELTTMTLIPQIVKAVTIPVIAAGGIASGEGMAAAFMLGAQGIQCGTCFLASDECNIHPKYKEMVVKASDISTIVTGRSTGHPVRCLKSPLIRRYIALEKEGESFETLEQLTTGSLKNAVTEGSYDEGSFMAGQIAGLIHNIRPCKEIIEDIVIRTQKIIAEKSKQFGGGI
ncbi:MAG: enoyl-[acyl-carrier-protein] reductase FabK [Clostridiaceae bacterium]|nr:enoyl-[acyl-carrier-protein] reductase FabK [Clostridiaceae bacterium]